MSHRITKHTDLKPILEAARNEMGLSQRQLSRDSGVGQNTYCMWVKSKSADMTLSSLLAYLKVLGLKLKIEG